MRKIFPRDFFETHEGYIFAAISHERDDEILSFLRYYPSEDGDRIRNGIRYKKVKTTKESFEILKGTNYIRNFGEYSIQVVNRKNIKKVYYPEAKLYQILNDNHPYKPHLKKLVETFKGLPSGITGSLLIDLFDENSDIDFVIYGRKNFLKAREILSSSDFVINKDGLKFVYMRRKPCIDFETFYKHEIRKYNKGIIFGKIFDILLVNYPDEVFKEEIVSIKRIGRVIKRLKVLDDTYVFDYPSIYITNGDIKYVICYTHTYVGQAFQGEEIIVSGILEKVNDSYYRILVGSTREAYNEYIISKTLILSNPFNT